MVWERSGSGAVRSTLLVRQLRLESFASSVPRSRNSRCPPQHCTFSPVLIHSTHHSHPTPPMRFAAPQLQAVTL